MCYVNAPKAIHHILCGFRAPTLAKDFLITFFESPQNLGTHASGLL